jgi:hypothetical protein
MLILEKELKDIELEEDLDKMLLNQLCGEIMDEVMDLGECSMICLLPRVPDPAKLGRRKS